MSERNKAIIEKANAAVAAGDYAEFVGMMSTDVTWTLLADTPAKMHGTDAILSFMTPPPGECPEPPKFTVESLIADGDFVVAVGGMTMQGKDGQVDQYAFCDVYRFADGMIAELRTFMNKT